MIYTFWNNKGGTGKTSLSFQAISKYAEDNPNEKILVLDVCPQANLSELFLGGLKEGAKNLLARYGEHSRASLGGYFQIRLPSPYTVPEFNYLDYITSPHKYNNNIPENIELVCGDPLLELQSNALSTLANQQIPLIDAWVGIASWIADFIKKTEGKYAKIFLDCNPSFSMYTQIALVATERLILPVMADDSSRRAIQNALSLIYGLKLPSELYAKYAFGNKLRENNIPLPKIHIIVKNRLTQYMGSASAYAAVLKTIEEDVTNLYQSNPEIFSSEQDSIFSDVRDFQTTGVVAMARGCPFSKLSSGRVDISGQRIQVNQTNISNCIKAITEITSKF